LSTERGDLVPAEGYLNRSLQIWEKLDPDGIGVAYDLNNLGDLAEDRGDIDAAQGYHLRALAIFEKLTPESGNVAASMQNLGSLAEDRGDLEKAREYLLRSLAIREKATPEGWTVAVSLTVLGDILTQQGDFSHTEEYLHHALKILEENSPNSLVTANAHHYLGNLAMRRGQPAQAEAEYRRGLDLRERIVPNSLPCAESYAALGRALRGQGKLDGAASAYSKAIETFENQIARLGGYDGIRSDYRAGHLDFYREYVDLLLTLNKPGEAFEILERSRARTLLETLRMAHADRIQGADRALLDQENALRDSLRTAAERNIAIADGGQKGKLTTPSEMDRLMARYREAEEKLRNSSPRYAELTQPRTLTVREVQTQLLDADSLILEYDLNEKQSHLFALTAAGINVYNLPPADLINSAARQFYRLLSAQNRIIANETEVQKRARLAKEQNQYARLASTLSGMILGPVATELAAKRLLIVSDGALQFIPFAALPLPGASAGSASQTPLVVKHEIVNLPSASVLAVLREERLQRKTAPTQSVAVIADPVFDRFDTRVQTSSAPRNSVVQRPSAPASNELSRSIEDFGAAGKKIVSLPRLAFSRQEAEAILTLAGKDQGFEALDFHANRELAVDPKLAQFRIVHIATHGLVNSRHPELSGLVFSLVDERGTPRNGFLDLADIYNLDLPVDLVVLSACQTALGKEVSGEGLVSLTRGFMYAGAPRVVASLWKVNDAATAAWMAEFYRGILRDGLTPAAALRQAQLSIWRQKRWSNPYDWAAFTLQGDWQ
jgi:CHAT domain-containing protein/Tfp pilus assembly protein PilF